MTFGEFVDIYLWPELKQGPKGFLNFFRNNFFSIGMFDIIFFSCIIALTVFGLAMHYSASYSTKSQLIFSIIGLVLMILVSQVKTSKYREISALVMIVATLFLFAVFVTPEYNGTRRTFLGIFQPSELAKVTLIMDLAYLLDKYSDKIHKTSTFYVFFGITIFFGALVLLESHLSGCILFLCIGYAMMWFSGEMPKKHFILWICLALLVVALVVWKPYSFQPLVQEYQADRIYMWKKILFGSELSLKERTEDGRQVLQSLYGIGSGGFFGKGFGNSGQKVSNLSEKANDFIFAVIGEELGFVGCLLLIALFGVLIFKGFKIGLDSHNMYNRLVCFGISTQMALQVLINIAVTTSILPNTGISLPFFSDGGSSMIFTMVSMGLMLGISKENKAYKKIDKGVPEDEG